MGGCTSKGWNKSLSPTLAEKSSTILCNVPFNVPSSAGIQLQSQIVRCYASSRKGCDMDVSLIK